MEVIIGIIGLLAGLIVAFFSGRKSGKTEAKIAQIEKTEEKIEKVKESDNAVNSKDRTGLIDSLVFDSVRKTDKD